MAKTDVVKFFNKHKNIKKTVRELSAVDELSELHPIDLNRNCFRLWIDGILKREPSGKPYHPYDYWME